MLFVTMWFDGEKKSYVEDEGANLNVLTTVLKSIVNCEALDVTKSL
jgi:hypothetical protein